VTGPDPPRCQRELQEPSPDTNIVSALLARHRDGGTSGRPAIEDDESELSYAGLGTAVDAAVARLRDAGIGPGDRVVLILDDSASTVAAMLALWQAAAVVVMLDRRISDDECRFAIHDAGARLALLSDVSKALVPTLVSSGCEVWDGAPASAGAPDRQPITPVTECDPALIQYTSGSTGRPKGVVHSHGSLRAPMSMFGKYIGLSEGDRCFSAAKLSFSYGLGSSILLPLGVGATTILWRGGVDPRTFVDVVRRKRPTLVYALPTIYAGVLEQIESGRTVDLSSVRLFVSAGEPLAPTLAAQWHERFRTPIVDGLGSTECGYIVIASPVDEVGTAMQAVTEGTVRVTDKSGGSATVGQIGYLQVSAPSLAAGYWAGADRPWAPVGEGGWTTTGDLVRLEAGGLRYTYVGRADDVLKVAGRKIAPTEIESVLREHPAVADAGVVGVVDTLGRSEIVAHLQLRPGSEANPEPSLRRHVRERLPSPKRPTRYVIVQSLPRTSTGKLSRQRLRERASAVAPPPGLTTGHD